jgi:hypothetical protein
MRAPIISRSGPGSRLAWERLWSQLAPRREAGGLGAVAVDVARSRRELVLENAVLRHQINVLRRRSKRSKLRAMHSRPGCVG